MTREEFRALLTPLVLAYRAEFDSPTWKAYYRALEDVPDALLVAAVEKSFRAVTPFMPKPGELRALAEIRRREMIEAHPYDRCPECNFIGKVAIREPGKPATYRACRCWDAYQAKIAKLGISLEPLALPEPPREMVAD